MFEGAPGRPTKCTSLKRLEEILHNLSYNDKNVPAYNDKLFHMLQAKDAWNANKKRVLKLPGLACYMRGYKNGSVSILVLLGCVLDVSLTPLGMRLIPLLFCCRK